MYEKKQSSKYRRPMIIGNGMIAKRFSAYAEDVEWLIFASGVSHSVSVGLDEFKRERDLLQQTLELNRDKKLIYFSTCSIYDPSLQQSPYVVHKRQMEELIQNQAHGYLIFRVSNPVGKTNNHHTFLNFIVDHISNGTTFSVWQSASRNLLDIDDMYHACNHIMQAGIYQNCIINIANPENYAVPEIVKAVERHLNKKANFKLAQKGSSPRIDISKVQDIFKELKIEFNQNYMTRLLQKYFPIT